MKALIPTLIAILLWFADTAFAAEIRVAAASNFRDALTELSEQFEHESANTITQIYGSSGKQFAQISNGAPFDVFLSADAERPRRLETEGLAVSGTRVTYALGRLALWSMDPGMVDRNGQVLRSDRFRHIALANPELAPYGIAAQQSLQALGVWDSMEKRRVLGENVGQAFQFVRTGNAELGLVAWSQLVAHNRLDAGSHWLVPRSLHHPIEQQAVLISDTHAAREFIAYLQSDQARTIIRAHGYETP